MDGIPEGGMKVLVTGFEPFEGMDFNPAQLVARLLAKQGCRKGACVTSRHLPVNRSGAEEIAGSLAMGPSTSEWDAVIHLGFESASKGLRFEISAANLLASDSKVPGSSGWSADVPCNTTGTGFYPIRPQGPCLLATTAPLDRLEMPLPSRMHHPHSHPLEMWSRDAGTFYCNEVFFRSLLVVRENMIRPRSHHAMLLPVLFVHLPPLSLSSVDATASFLWEVISRITSLEVVHP